MIRQERSLHGPTGSWDPPSLELLRALDSDIDE
jgi:hypothetical protein